MGSRYRMSAPSVPWTTLLPPSAGVPAAARGRCAVRIFPNPENPPAAAAGRLDADMTENYPAADAAGNDELFTAEELETALKVLGQVHRLDAEDERHIAVRRATGKMF